MIFEPSLSKSSVPNDAMMTGNYLLKPHSNDFSTGGLTSTFSFPVLNNELDGGFGGFSQSFDQNKWPILPSIQAYPKLSHSLTTLGASPILKAEKDFTNQSPIQSLLPNFSEDSKLVSSLSNPNLDSIDQIKSSKVVNGRNSPKSICDGSLTCINDKLQASDPTSIMATGIEEKNENLVDRKGNEIECDFDSLYASLEDIGSLQETDVYPNSLTLGESNIEDEIYFNPQISTHSTSSSEECLNTNRAEKRSRRMPSEEDDLSSCTIKRCRRLNNIVPYPRRPRTAEYLCSKCLKCYQHTVSDNSWWAVYHHECPFCNEIQCPRIDINTEVNSIESDPNMVALYGEGTGDLEEEEEEEDDSESYYDDNSDDDMDLESCFIEGGTSGATGSEKKMDVFPFDEPGQLSSEHASKLLVLMNHARTCSGVHINEGHADVCRSVKFLMLHCRDCNGLDASGGTCSMSWCLPCKRFLFHLAHCFNAATCSVCNAGVATTGGDNKANIIDHQQAPPQSQLQPTPASSSSCSSHCSSHAMDEECLSF